MRKTIVENGEQLTEDIRCDDVAEDLGYDLWRVISQKGPRL
jgi:hypothetical protein